MGTLSSVAVGALAAVVCVAPLFALFAQPIMPFSVWLVCAGLVSINR